VWAYRRPLGFDLIEFGHVGGLSLRRMRQPIQDTLDEVEFQRLVQVVKVEGDRIVALHAFIDESLPALFAGPGSPGA
jgi:hypothetical protein